MAARNILDDIADLKRRLNELERATRNPQMSGGDIDELDEGYDGAIVLNRLGTDINPPDFDAVALLIAQHGWEIPALGADWQKGSDFTTVTSGSFTGTYTQQYFQAIADAVQVRVVCVCDVGTTGEVRLHNDVIGGDSSDAVAFTSAGLDETFNWLHGQDIGNGPCRPQVQARRTGGAGDVYVFAPLAGHQIGGRWISATTGGA